MAATTYWVRSSGGDDVANTGLSYAQGYATIAKGLLSLASADPGSTLNIVNDGTHAWPAVAASSATAFTTAGTSYTNFGVRIRGTDSSGSAAMTTIAPAGAGVHGFFRMNSGAAYFIVENLIFDSSSQAADNAAHVVAYMRDNNAGPVKVRYCAMIGGNSGTCSTGRRELVEMYTGSNTDSFVVEYCYFQNCASPIYTPGNGYGGTLTKTKVDHCVGIWDANGRGTGWYQDANYGADKENDVTFTYNTLYESVGNNATKNVVYYTASAGVDLGTANIYSNLIWQDSTKTSDAILEFLEGGSSDATNTVSGFIGANVLLGGSNVASTDLTSDGWYTGMWDSGSDPQSTDTAAYEVADTTIFNDPSSTYAWELPNGLTITILKDLRPIEYEDAGRFGGVPGALASAATATEDPDDVTDPNDAASVPYIDVLPLIGDDLQYSATIRLGATQNRATHYYDRIDRENIRWAEYSAHTLELATNTTTRVTMGGIETGEILLLESTTGIQVSINATNMFFPSSKMVAVKSSFDSVLVKNPSTTSSATITMAVVD